MSTKSYHGFLIVTLPVQVCNKTTLVLIAHMRIFDVLPRRAHHETVEEFFVNNMRMAMGQLPPQVAIGTAAAATAQRLPATGGAGRTGGVVSDVNAASGAAAATADTAKLLAALQAAKEKAAQLETQLAEAWAALSACQASQDEESCPSASAAGATVREDAAAAVAPSSHKKKRRKRSKNG